MQPRTLPTELDNLGPDFQNRGFLGEKRPIFYGTAVFAPRLHGDHGGTQRPDAVFALPARCESLAIADPRGTLRGLMAMVRR